MKRADMGEQAGLTMSASGVALIPRANYRAMRWRNGQGVTHEIARSPAEGDFDWRVSIAHVPGSGDFSEFRDCVRWMMLLSGDGMDVVEKVGGKTVAALHRIGDIGTYPGDGAHTGVLRGGEVWDLNFIARRHIAGSLTHRMFGDAPLRLAQLRGETFVLPLQQALTVMEDGRQRELPAWSALHLVGQCEVYVSGLANAGGTAAAVIAIDGGVAA